MERDRSPVSHQFDQHRAEVWRHPPAPDLDPTLRATQYLGVLRDLAVQRGWISLAHIADPPGAALVWIGQNIHRTNQQLHAILNDALDCFEPAQRPGVQIFAAPIAPEAGVDGFCSDGLGLSSGHLGDRPITLMVDPGRIVPADWPKLVAHELAHGVVRSAGHGEKFSRAIAHLCLAQDLPLPPPTLSAEGLRSWPPCRRTPRPELFWLGQVSPGAALPEPK